LGAASSTSRLRFAFVNVLVSVLMTQMISDGRDAQTVLR
jgi:hypothetical protein